VIIASKIAFKMIVPETFLVRQRLKGPQQSIVNYGLSITTSASINKPSFVIITDIRRRAFLLILDTLHVPSPTILYLKHLNLIKPSQMNKPSKFILIATAVLSSGIILSSWQDKKKTNREFYELTVYHFSTSIPERILDDYFQNALLPALHRKGTKNVAVLKAWANDTATDKLVYVFVPLHSLDDLVKNKEELTKDQVYTTAASDYLNADPKNPVYSRMEKILLRAFPLAPQMHLPSLQSSKRSRVYELRSYESATEKKFESKVKMFNEGNEIALFKRLNFNSVFYSEVIAGSKMPNLMYMTSFESRQDRDAHWKTFSNDSAWKKLSGLPEYQNNVSHIDINFLYPADYSDF
jgi:hypothetical protein